MSKYVFRNDKPYVVSVPTPYGGSLSVPSGSSVAGDYFIEFHRQSPILTPVDPGTVHPRSIVGEFNTAKTRQKELVEAQSHEVTFLQEPPQELPIPKDIAEPPVKNKGGRPPKKSLEDAAKDLWKEVTFVQPDASDVDKMSSSDLARLSQKLSIPKTLSESAQRVAIKEKLRSA